MKIEKVDVMQVECKENSTWRPIICRIYTDEGLYGDGEAMCQDNCRLNK